MNGKLIVIDTSGFFAPAECLNGINPAQGEETKVSLVTLDLMIFRVSESDRARRR